MLVADPLHRAAARERPATLIGAAAAAAGGRGGCAMASARGTVGTRSRRLQRVGGAIGTAALAVVLTARRGPVHSPDNVIHGFQSAYWVALGIAALGIIPCVVLRAERRAAAGRGRAATAAVAPRSREPDHGDRAAAGREQYVDELRAAFREFRGRSGGCADATRTSRSGEMSDAQFELLVELARARRLLGRRARLRRAS